jgi:hypothetical protein
LKIIFFKICQPKILDFKKILIIILVLSILFVFKKMKILESAIRKIKKTGKTKSQAIAIALATLKKAKILTKDGKLTKLGEAREALGSKGRKKETVQETLKRIRKRKK